MVLSKPTMTVNGQQVDAENDRRLPVVNPYTREEFASIPDASAADVDAAVQAARRTFDKTWSQVPGIERGRLLMRLADLVESHAEELGDLETQDNGKLLRETTKQVGFSARTYRFFAGYADKLYGLSIPLDDNATLDYTIREPVGVSALITAWNSPMQLLSNKLAPALAAGNTVVVKPSEHASLTTLRIADLTREAGFPDGVVNVISGGREAGEALTAHSGLDHISFTGGVETGQAVARAAATHLIPVTLELGGKSPNIVFADANLDNAVTGAIAGIFAAGGQSCIAGSRLLVERSVYNEVAQRVSARAADIRLGDPSRPDTEMGPVANEAQYERIQQLIDLGLASGARRTTTAEVRGSGVDRGYFIPPTVFADVDNSMEIAQREVFGPVLSIIGFDSEDEAVAIANGTEFGLASAVWTKDISRAHRVARRLVSGSVWVNTYRKSAVQTPAGGVRKSGYGRERGAESLNEFLRTKNVMVDLSDTIDDPFTMRF